MNKLHHTCLGLIAASLLAGRASTEKTSSATNKPAPAKAEYVQYTPTGSWISKKVKKEQVKTSEQETTEAQMALEELQRRGNQVPKDH